MGYLFTLFVLLRGRGYSYVQSGGFIWQRQQRSYLFQSASRQGTLDANYLGPSSSFFFFAKSTKNKNNIHTDCRCQTVINKQGVLLWLSRRIGRDSGDEEGKNAVVLRFKYQIQTKKNTNHNYSASVNNPTIRTNTPHTFRDKYNRK